MTLTPTPKSVSTLNLMKTYSTLIHADDAGEANFQVETTDNSFQLQVRWLHDVGRFLQVNWKSTNPSQFTVFPPPSPNSTIGKLGWIHDGSLCMLIKEKTMLPSLPAKLAT